MLVEEEGSTYMADNDGDSDEARTLRPLQAAACTYRIAFGPRVGQKVLTVHGAMPRETDFKQSLCADIDGFSLHAAVRCGADDRRALEQPCRYIARLALANERVQTNAAGQVVLRLKTAWRDGTTHLVMSPLDLKMDISGRFVAVKSTNAASAEGRPAPVGRASSPPASDPQVEPPDSRHPRPAVDDPEQPLTQQRELPRNGRSALSMSFGTGACSHLSISHRGHARPYRR